MSSSLVAALAALPTVLFVLLLTALLIGAAVLLMKRFGIPLWNRDIQPIS